jgi:aspartokinase/homoserine dehydrogenase 1
MVSQNQTKRGLGKWCRKKIIDFSKELDLQNEFEEIQNLIQNICVKEVLNFLTKLKNLILYDEIKTDQKPNHVLRYIGELWWFAKWQGFWKSNGFRTFGYCFRRLKGSDSFFEIYNPTETDQSWYKERELDQQLRLEVFWRYLEIIW